MNEDPMASTVRRLRTPAQVSELVELVVAGYRLEAAVWDAYRVTVEAGIDRGDLPGCTFGLRDLEDLALEIDRQHDGAGAVRALEDRCGMPRRKAKPGMVTDHWDVQPAGGRLNVPRLREWGHQVDGAIHEMKCLAGAVRDGLDVLIGRVQRIEHDLADRLELHPDRIADRLADVPARLTERLGDLEDRQRIIEARLERVERLAQ